MADVNPTLPDSPANSGPVAGWHPTGKFIYFAQLGSLPFVKIGRARDVGVRLGGLKTGTPFQLRLLGAIPEYREFREADFHDVYGRSRCNGEWFALTEDLRGFLDSVGFKYEWRPGVLGDLWITAMPIEQLRELNRNLRADVERLEAERAKCADTWEI